MVWTFVGCGWRTGVSQLGTRMTFLAAPLVAVQYLHASAFEVALVRATQTFGALLFGLLAGAWVDRIRCRPVLIGTDLGRFVLLLAVGVLSVWPGCSTCGCCTW